jgi:hypothetical protein
LKLFQAKNGTKKGIEINDLEIEIMSEYRVKEIF